jgi:hypothetical protein
MADDKPRFQYHAHAFVLQGEITHPFEEKLEAQAPSAVSPFGGFGFARADPFNLREVVSHRGGRSRTEGGYNPKTDEHYAVAAATLEGFNISDVVTADSVLARLTAVHSTSQEEPAISPHGSAIHNLRIAGHAIELIPLVGTYHTLDTLGKVREHYKANAEFRESFHRDTYVGKEAELPEKKRKFFPWRRHQTTGQLPEFRGHTIVPLFRIVDPNVPGIEVHGSVIEIDHFGRLHIGELLISRDERRVTMIHADLGSPQSADLVASSVCSGTGQTDP